jgi:hypothetical protein
LALKYFLKRLDKYYIMVYNNEYEVEIAGNDPSNIKAVGDVQ